MQITLNISKIQETLERYGNAITSTTMFIFKVVLKTKRVRSTGLKIFSC